MSSAVSAVKNISEDDEFLKSSILKREGIYAKQKNWHVVYETKSLRASGLAQRKAE